MRCAGGGAVSHGVEGLGSIYGFGIMRIVLVLYVCCGSWGLSIEETGDGVLCGFAPGVFAVYACFDGW